MDQGWIRVGVIHFYSEQEFLQKTLIRVIHFLLTTRDNFSLTRGQGGSGSGSGSDQGTMILFNYAMLVRCFMSILLQGGSPGSGFRANFYSGVDFYTTLVAVQRPNGEPGRPFLRRCMVTTWPTR